MRDLFNLDQLKRQYLSVVYVIFLHSKYAEHKKSKEES